MNTLMVLLAILAFAMGIQTATAVRLGVHAVFTTAGDPPAPTHGR